MRSTPSQISLSLSLSLSLSPHSKTTADSNSNSLLLNFESYKSTIVGELTGWWWVRDTMRLFLRSSSSSKEVGGSNRSLLYLNVYDLTPINNYLYWFGFGIFHSGIEGLPSSFLQRMHQHNCSSGSPTLGACWRSLHIIWHIGFCSLVHGLEYGFGAHEYPTSGVFEVEPKSCPGFIFRRSILLGSTDMSCSEFRSFMEHLSGKYHGDSYHLIAKNCNHFTEEVCMRLTGKPIPGWVNRLARLGSFCHCLLPESIQATAVRHLPDHLAYSDDRSDSGGSSVEIESEEEPDHHLLTIPNGDVAFVKEKPVRLAKDLL
ncbi:deSI-like protein At4g17486 isoform X2 [Rhododendron vialii]|uniref:deSI-like protein At4g17486 isoform X2 n=1 Tax=Rhododendron vialii TaxID=182163 RepID=UPI0026600091|nr:deSI-like protein At4g17486 isoform X2 [Rhododendron vialii]